MECSKYTGYRLQRIIRCKKTARYKWVLVVDNFFNTAKKSAYYIQVLVVTEFVVSGTQCNT